MSVTVKKAVASDAAVINNIVKKAFILYGEAAGERAAENALKESVEATKNDILTKICYIAYSDEKPVGTVRVLLDGEVAYLSRFGVLPEYQKGGFGKALMRAVDKDMVRLGVKKICLHTASRHRELVRFYYGFGYFIQDISTDRGYIRALMCKEY